MNNSVVRFLKSQLFWFGLAFAAVAFFMYQYLNTKAKTQDKAPLPEIPDNGVNIPPSYENTARSIATQLKDALTGIFTMAVDKEKVFVTLNNLTNDQLVYVYRVFNNMYFSDSGETMTEWIENEWNVTLKTVRPQLLSRLKSLGCL